MDRPNIVEKLKASDLMGRVLSDLLGLDEIPRPGAAIRCVYPDRHKNGDRSPSLVVSKDHAGATCMACGFGGSLLTVAVDRLGVASEAEAAAKLERKYISGSRWNTTIV